MKVIAYAILVVLVAVAIVAAYGILTSPTYVVEANPNECPEGQRENCKWVQHRQSGKCMWLPDRSVAWPWEEVTPAGVCPVVAPRPTNTLPYVAPTATLISATATQPQATATNDPDPKSTDEPTATATQRPTDLQVQPTVAKTLAVYGTAGPACDTCGIMKTQAAAQSTMAAALSTMAAKK